MLKTLGIQDLEAYTGLPRRTIHFYVKEGLIPPPEGAGRGAYYGWHHVHALKLINALKAETHLRLEGIRGILRMLDPAGLREWARAIEDGSSTATELAARLTLPRSPHVLEDGAALAAFDRLDEDGEPPNLMYSIDAPVADAEAGLELRQGAVMDPGSEGPDEPDGDETDEPMRLIDMPEDEPMRIGATRSRSLFSRLMRKGPSDEAEHPAAPETWRRIRLADDVEIQIRDDADDKRRRQIEVIIELAKGMLDE